ncbi:hypothetical protein J3459_014177, partial [Metarhizium acridum]
ISQRSNRSRSLLQNGGFLGGATEEKSRFNKNGIPEDPALARLKLLRRTVRENPTKIGSLVQFLKTPYMIRESCHVELAQMIAKLPMLQYVDLPEGMFCDDPAYTTLRLEVQAKCPFIKKATYASGAERSFVTLVSGQIWPDLEVLELTGLKIDPHILRAVLSCLPELRALKVSETYSLSDDVLVADENLPPLHRSGGIDSQGYAQSNISRARGLPILERDIASPQGSDPQRYRHSTLEASRSAGSGPVAQDFGHSVQGFRTISSQRACSATNAQGVEDTPI